MKTITRQCCESKSIKTKVSIYYLYLLHTFQYIHYPHYSLMELAQKMRSTEDPLRFLPCACNDTKIEIMHTFLRHEYYLRHNTAGMSPYRGSLYGNLYAMPILQVEIDI